MSQEPVNPPPSDNEIDEHMDKSDVPPSPRAGLSYRALATLWGASIVLSVSVATLIQHYANPPLRIATVDIGLVVEAQQLLMTERFLANKEKSLDQNAGEAYDNVAKFGKQLEETLAAMRAECKCLILTKGAVVGDAPLNLTTELRSRLGLGAVDAPAIRAKLNEQFTIDPRQALGQKR